MITIIVTYLTMGSKNFQLSVNNEYIDRVNKNSQQFHHLYAFIDA